MGLSVNEALIYEILLKEGSLDAKSLAKIAGVLPNALYRLLAKLQNKGLITASGRHSTFYYPISPAFALDAYVKEKVSELEITKEHLITQLSSIKSRDQTRIDLVRSAYEFFLTYAKLAREVNKEIAIISIGEQVPEEVLLANRDAIERGVVIRLIVHKSDKSNNDLLKSWKKMGLEVKHYPGWGFHLVVFDKKKSLLSVNSPERTNERLALLIYSKGLAKAHADYFSSVWKKAEEIK